MLARLSVLCLCMLNAVHGYTQCYGSLGCFDSYSNIPVPQDPSTIGTTFILHNRANAAGYSMKATEYATQLKSFESHFDSSKKTKVLIHGFLDSAAKPWMGKMVTELLKKGDFNVFVVDWHGGSVQTYEHAAGNTYLVAAETAALLKDLHDNHGLAYSDVHIIGHSLGAQTAGSVGHAIPSIARITGLDPADPGFTGSPASRHLDKTDAVFVDVIHTDASKFNLVSGYGTRDAVGDVDFYPNGGDHQPGCDESPVLGVIGGVSHGSISGASGAITCSHSRSRDLFTESINSACKFYGHLCPSGDSFEAGSCLGCPKSGCPMMGYDADQSQSQTGTFYLSTSGVSPFCGHEYFVDIKAADHVRRTYGEFIVTLIGTKGESEPLKLESQMHMFHDAEEDRHVIATHNDIGQVTGVRVKYVRGLALLTVRYVVVHSVKVQSAESNQVTTICAHEQRFNAGDVHTLTSHTGC